MAIARWSRWGVSRSEERRGALRVWVSGDLTVKIGLEPTAVQVAGQARLQAFRLSDGDRAMVAVGRVEVGRAAWSSPGVGEGRPDREDRARAHGRSGRRPGTPAGLQAQRWRSRDGRGGACRGRKSGVELSGCG